MIRRPLVHLLTALIMWHPCVIPSHHGSPLLKRMITMGVAGTAAYKAYSAYTHYQQYQQNYCWPWATIGTDDGYTPNEFFRMEKGALPDNFYFGAGNAAMQSEGGITNSTYNLPASKDKYPELQGAGNDSWHTWDRDLQLIKELGLNAYRVSVEWSRIQPDADTFDQAVLAEYARRCTDLINNNVMPLIGMHHYSDPQWFMYPTGDMDHPVGFEDEKNCQKFVEFSVKTIRALHRASLQALATKSPAEQKKFLPHFYSYNSPNAYALNGYMQGERPPYVRDMQRAMNVYENMLNAHNQIYRALKKQDSSVCFGITTNIFPLDAQYPQKKSTLATICSWSVSYLGSWFGNWISNSAGCAFFTDNQLTVLVPGKATKNMRPWRAAHALFNRYFFNPADKTLDFICVNYYSHGVMNGFAPSTPDNELKTGNPRYTVYAEGLYRAIKEVSERVARPLGIPVLVAENGFSGNDVVEQGNPVDSEQRRKLFLNRHLYALTKAYKDGYPIAGYMYWCLYDNVEWADGYKKNYGLADRNRVAKESGRHYARLIAPFTR